MSDWSGRRVLVTGATGLVGSTLVPELIGLGADVIAFVRDWDPQSELLRSGDIQRTTVVSARLEEFDQVERALVEYEVDTVFHLGAWSIVGTANRSPRLALEANVRGTYNLLDACRLHKEHIRAIVIASSDKAYGTAPTLPYDESMPLQGAHPYDVSKSCADLISQAYFHTYALPIVIARCGNIYGRGDLNWNRLIPGTIRLLLAGERPIIRSDGSFRRDYISVADAASAYIRMAERVDSAEVKGQGFNFGPGVSHSALEVVDLLRTIMGRDDLEPIIENRAHGEIRDQHLDSTLASKVLDWTPSQDLESGLRETIGWYQAYLGAAERGE